MFADHHQHRRHVLCVVRGELASLEVGVQEEPGEADDGVERILLVDNVAEAD
ncbi:hypothetical protein [Streptomyces sp. NPDC093544]|uniref:hypothetical protein n=1 Tax=Streptomyces sp. NPDC093544 TaxID=3155200 RepID=UPI00343DB046